MSKKLVLVLLAVYLISLAAAEIMISQPLKVYNYGDKLDIKADVRTSEETNGFFELSLECNNIENNFYRVPLNMNGGKTLDTSLLLVPKLGEGLCKIYAFYDGQKDTSQEFEISKELKVQLNTGDIIAEAGKSFTIYGTAERENGKKAEGFVEFSLGNDSVKSVGEVKKGFFSSNFSFPENAKSGSYNLAIRVYEEYNNEITNEGTANLAVFVKQTPKSILSYIENQSVSPEETFRIRAGIFDQANDIIYGEIMIKVKDVNNKLIIQKVVESNKDYEMKLNGSSVYGYWNIETEAMNLTGNNQFYVREYEKASFKVINGTLTIKNVGNVIYKKDIKITIGDYSEIKNLNLEVGEEIKLRLNAPEGNYEIKISDGTDEIVTSGFLTGNTIGVGEFAEKNFRYYVAWIFLIMVIGLFVGALAMNGKFRKTSRGIIPAEAEHAVVIEGRKEQAGVVVTKIRGNADIKIIEKTKETIKKNKGAAYSSNDAIIGIFQANDMLAVRTADAISSMIREHNKLAKSKVDYGIGVNSGEIIVKREDKLRFSGVGNTIPLAKKIAELSNNEVLLSESINMKVMNEVKTVRKQLNGLNIYNIKDFSNREQYNGFINGFLDRQKK